MSATLAEKIRNARHKSVEIKGITFNYSRPTDLQVASMYQESGGEHSKPEVAKMFVFGWSGVKESDLIPDGLDEPAPFDKETFDEWIKDSRDFWAPLYEAIMGSYVEYTSSREDEIKN